MSVLEAAQLQREKITVKVEVLLRRKKLVVEAVALQQKGEIEAEVGVQLAKVIGKVGTARPGVTRVVLKVEVLLEVPGAIVGALWDGVQNRQRKGKRAPVLQGAEVEVEAQMVVNVVGLHTVVLQVCEL